MYTITMKVLVSFWGTETGKWHIGSLSFELNGREEGSSVFALNNLLKSIFKIFHTQKRALCQYRDNRYIKIHIKKIHSALQIYTLYFKIF